MDRLNLRNNWWKLHTLWKLCIVVEKSIDRSTQIYEEKSKDVNILNPKSGWTWKQRDIDRSIIGENRQLVTNEPVEFEK